MTIQNEGVFADFQVVFLEKTKLGKIPIIRDLDNRHTARE